MGIRLLRHHVNNNNNNNYNYNYYYYSCCCYQICPKSLCLWNCFVFKILWKTPKPNIKFRRHKHIKAWLFLITAQNIISELLRGMLLLFHEDRYFMTVSLFPWHVNITAFFLSSSEYIAEIVSHIAILWQQNSVRVPQHQTALATNGEKARPAWTCQQYL